MFLSTLSPSRDSRLTQHMVPIYIGVTRVKVPRSTEGPDREGNDVSLRESQRATMLEDQPLSCPSMGGPDQWLTSRLPILLAVKMCQDAELLD